MIIDLPEYELDKPLVINEHMKIENGILKLKLPFSLRNVMYILTYKIKGKHICTYCGKEISNNKVTLDHVIPQDFGGPTITNNLEPCCCICNQQKSNMTKEQYFKFLSLSSTERKQFLKDIRKNLDFVHKYKSPILPQDWMEETRVENILVSISLSENYKGSKYEKVKEYYTKYGHFQRPIVVDKKNFLLDGFIILMYAKNNGIQKVPVIVLENVEVTF